MKKTLSAKQNGISSAIPCISIITVCRNSAATIARTIDSVLRQKENIIEYIILDGASTDGTADIIRSFERQFDGKLRWRSEPDGGIYYAMNKGIAMARGSLIGILNSDDWYEDDAITSVAAVHAASPASVIHGLVRIVRDGKVSMVRGSSHHFLDLNMIEHPTCFVPAEMYRLHGSFDTRYRLLADYELILRFARKGAAFHWEEKILANFSVGGATTVAYLQSLKERAGILRRYGFFSRRKYYIELLKIQTKIIFRRFSI
jgi:glycosyltransferase involved in cell wall biosynthesis